jgi:hypothetical protein
MHGKSNSLVHHTIFLQLFPNETIFLQPQNNEPSNYIYLIDLGIFFFVGEIAGYSKIPVWRDLLSQLILDSNLTIRPTLQSADR